MLSPPYISPASRLYLAYISPIPPLRLPQDTAIFDVLSPPYDDLAGRSCHYYELGQVRDRVRVRFS